MKIEDEQGAAAHRNQHIQVAFRSRESP